MAKPRNLPPKSLFETPSPELLASYTAFIDEANAERACAEARTNIVSMLKKIWDDVLGDVAPPGVYPDFSKDMLKYSPQLIKETIKRMGNYKIRDFIGYYKTVLNNLAEEEKLAKAASQA